MNRRSIPREQLVIISMSLPKLGDYLLLTPLLQQILRARGTMVTIAVADMLSDLYTLQGFLPGHIRQSELSPDAASPPTVIDLTHPLLPTAVVPPTYQRLPAAPFDPHQHVSRAYAQALHHYFEEIDLAFEIAPFIDLDADPRILGALNLRPFEYFTVHTGSDFAPKNWMPGKFRDTLELIHRERPDLICVELIGPTDQPLFDEQDRPSWLRSLEVPLLTVAQVLAGTTFHLDNDSGVHHLAGAMDVPTISVWGPTPPGTWGSISRSHFVHWGGPSCENHCGGTRMVECTDRVCLKSIDPRDLVISARRILSAYA